MGNNNRSAAKGCAIFATIIVGKQRNGPIGQFELHFHKEYTKFSDLAR